MGKKALFLVFIAFLCSAPSIIKAQNPNISSAVPIFNDLQGYIPLYFRGDIASDLKYKGKARHPDEVFSFWQKGIIKDISLLNPVENYTYQQSTYSLNDWKNQIRTSLPKELAETGNNFEYVSYETERLGLFRFVVKDSRGKVLNISIGPRSINRKLNQTALHKLGYETFAMSSLNRARVYFRDLISKRRFLTNINKKLSALVVDENKVSLENQTNYKNYLAKYIDYISDSFLEPHNYIEFYNPVLSEPAVKFQNLAFWISPDHIKGKRKYASLQLVYAWLDIPESLNLFSYSIGSIFDERLFLNFSGATNYSTNLADAIWMATRISRLSERDIQEIAQSAKFPGCPSLLLNEILKSRRNDLIHILKTRTYLKDERSHPIHQAKMYPVDNKLNCKKEVRNGVQIKKKYESHGNRFRHDRYEGPFVGTEIWSIIKSIGFSNLLGNAMLRLNQEMPKTNLSQKNYEYKLDQAARQFAHFFATGETLETEFGSYRIPFYNTGLNYSRDLVVGPYLGTSNAVQLVENFGFQLGVGNFYGFDGLESNELMSGIISAGYQFSLSHIQPIEIEQPKMENSEEEAKGAFEKALEVQYSDVLNIFRLPFDAFDKFGEYKELKTDPLTELNLENRAFVKFLRVHAPKNANELLFVLNQFLDDSDKNKIAEQVKKLSSIWLKLWKESKEDYFKILRELAKKETSQEELSEQQKSLNPIKLRISFLKELEELPLKLSKRKAIHFDQVVDQFMEKVDVGDSIIAHHNFDMNAALNLGLAVTTPSAWFLDLKAGKQKLYRTHLYRVDNKHFQVYRSIANKEIAGIVTGIRLYFRFLSLGYEYSFGDVQSRMYTVKIEKLKSPNANTLPPNSEEAKFKSYVYDSEIQDKMKAFKKLFFTGSLEGIKSIAQPVRINHEFVEDNFNFNFLWWQADSVENFHKMKITDLDGEGTELYRYTEGARFGANYQDFALNYVNAYINEHTEEDVLLNVKSNSDPGRSFFGYSSFRQGSMEAVIPKEGSIDNQCISLQYRWNQFIAQPEDLKRELTSYKEKFGLDLGKIEHHARTERLDLFSFQTIFNIYNKGIENILKFPREEFEKLVTKHLNLPKRSGLLMQCKSRVYEYRDDYKERLKECHIDSMIRSFSRVFRELLEAYSYKDHEEYMKALTSFVFRVEKYLDPIVLHRIVGGRENIFMISLVEGYRKGEESTEARVYLNSYGRSPGPFNVCPVQAMANHLNFQQSEMLLYWLNTRL